MVVVIIGAFVGATCFFQALDQATQFAVGEMTELAGIRFGYQRVEFLEEFHSGRGDANFNDAAV